MREKLNWEDKLIVINFIENLAMCSKYDTYNEYTLQESINTIKTLRKIKDKIAEEL